MALTDAEIYQIRREVGGAPDDTELNNIYDRLDSLGGVVMEVLQTRLANFLRSPASITVFGDVALSNEANIIALREQLKRLAGEIADDTGLAGAAFVIKYAASKGR